jgi:hypothetical protein
MSISKVKAPRAGAKAVVFSVKDNVDHNRDCQSSLGQSALGEVKPLLFGAEHYTFRS